LPRRGPLRQPDVTLRWHDWWAAPRTLRAVHEIDPEASHASWMEGFAWTRVEGVEPPTGHKATVDLADRSGMSAEGFRARLGDGYFGGFYARPEEDLAKVWGVAVEETRARIQEGW
jgi:creatinine amidohydrolase